MCIVFSVTAPIGMVLGMILYTATGYEPKSANALIMEGIAGSLASGILLYMAFVKFTAVEFFYSKVMMGSRPWMKKLCFFLFVVGCASITFLIIWVWLMFCALGNNIISALWIISSIVNQCFFKWHFIFWLFSFNCIFLMLFQMLQTKEGKTFEGFSSDTQIFLEGPVTQIWILKLF